MLNCVLPVTGSPKGSKNWAPRPCHPPLPSQPRFHSLIPTGPRTLLIGSKGCTGRGAQDNSSVSIYSRPPGMLVASYTRFCSSNLCNEASSSSVLLSSLPHPSMGPRHLGFQLVAGVESMQCTPTFLSVLRCPSHWRPEVSCLCRVIRILLSEHQICHVPSGDHSLL